MRRNFETLDVLHNIDLPSLLDLVAAIIEHDAVRPKQHDCIRKQDAAFWLPFEEGLLRFGELKGREGWFEDGNLILVYG